jgi:EF-P beta-lysylation protein EpmB
MGAASYRVARGNRTSLAQPTEVRSTAAQNLSWQQQLRDAVREPGELERLLELPPGSLPRRADRNARFPLLVPHAFVARMHKGDPFDPLLRQVLPAPIEDQPADGFSDDPLTEFRLADHGSISKYPGRALMIATGACPVHCRYCFRRAFPYPGQTASRADWQPALDAIRSQPGIREIILSGGDPLSLGNDRLRRLIARIESLPAISSLRIHTRFPIVLPARIDDELTDMLASTRLDTVIVVHANHPAEIDESVVAAAAALKRCSGYLFNQSVLLRNINDDVRTLIRLSERLQHAGIVPYYLHLLDRVSGAAHFEVDEAKARALIVAMRRQIPGYLVPALVRDQPGELSKTPIV